MKIKVLLVGWINILIVTFKIDSLAELPTKVICPK